MDFDESLYVYGQVSRVCLSNKIVIELIELIWIVGYLLFYKVIILKMEEFCYGWELLKFSFICFFFYYFELFGEKFDSFWGFILFLGYL